MSTKHLAGASVPLKVAKVHVESALEGDVKEAIVEQREPVLSQRGAAGHASPVSGARRSPDSDGFPRWSWRRIAFNGAEDLYEDLERARTLDPVGAFRPSSARGHKAAGGSRNRR